MGEKMKVGKSAKSFALKDHNGKGFSLAEQRGKRVLLSFHPLAWTSVCAQQMQSLEAHKAAFDSLNTTAVGISVDSVPCKKAWAESLNVKNTSLLSDFWPHGHVAQLYGLFRNDDGISERANVVVDEAGTVTFYKVYPISELPNIEEVLTHLRIRPSN
jgi:peroxiredoxin